MTTPYPARIAFKLAKNRRARVLAAANELGLTVTDIAGDEFVVIVPSPEAAYALGLGLNKQQRKKAVPHA